MFVFEWNDLNHPLPHREVKVHVCARGTDSRSAEDCLLTRLLCLVGTLLSPFQTP